MMASELREMGDTELSELLAEHKEELFNLRFQNVTGQLDNPNRMSQVKREIARVLTVLREREMAASAAGVSATAGDQE
jgi:large subunit ribosomal protein L29